MIISFNLFTLILSLRKNDTNIIKIKKINELIILFKSNRTFAIIFCIILFSVAGIPPLLGFYGKFYLFTNAIRSELYIITFIITIISVIGSMYYLRLIKLIFFTDYDYWTSFQKIVKTNALIISYTFIINIYFFLHPVLILLYINNLSLSFYF